MKRMWAEAQCPGPSMLGQCNRKVICKGFCRAHWEQNHKGKPLTPIRQDAKSGTWKGVLCNAPLCNRPVKCKGLCATHCKYNASKETLHELFNNQNGQCAICEQEFSLEFPYCIDHDHKCCSGPQSCGNCVRGFLCRLCNRTYNMIIETHFQRVKTYHERWT